MWTHHQVTHSDGPKPRVLCILWGIRLSIMNEWILTLMHMYSYCTQSVRWLSNSGSRLQKWIFNMMSCTNNLLFSFVFHHIAHGQPFRFRSSSWHRPKFEREPPSLLIMLMLRRSLANRWHTLPKGFEKRHCYLLQILNVKISKLTIHLTAIAKKRPVVSRRYVCSILKAISAISRENFFLCGD